MTQAGEQKSLCPRRRYKLEVHENSAEMRKNMITEVSKKIAAGVVSETACPCRRALCPRHGDCSSCRRHHEQNTNMPLPYCEQKLRSAQKQAKKQRRPEAVH